MILIYFIVCSFMVFTEHGSAYGNEIAEKNYYDIDLAESLFKKYIYEHQKQYSDNEMEYRLEVFKENLKSINELNKKHEDTVFGLTSFSDLTPEEFKNVVSCLKKPDVETISVSTDVNAPDELDYRKQNLVTDVKDQGICGSCYIFGAMGEVEGQYAKKHKNLVMLSEQYPLDCLENFTCFGGDCIYVIDWLATTPGALAMKDYPNMMWKFNCTADPKKGLAKIKGGNYFAVNTSEALKTVLLDHGPMAIGIYASPEIQNYVSGIISPSDCKGTEEIDHAVVLIGYGMGKKPHWLIKNSWGKNWGEKGYIRLAFDKCGVGSYLTTSEVE